MRHMTVRVALSLMAFTVALGQAYAQEKYTLRYQPKADTWQEKLTGDLLDVGMQGQSLGVKGNVVCSLTAKTAAAPEGKLGTVLGLEFGQAESSLNGQPGNPPAMPPLALTMSSAGQLLDFQSKSDAPMNFMDTGGLPIQILALLTHVVRFSDAPVAVGEDWLCQDKYQVPSMGEVPINTRWRLGEVKDGVATLVSTAAAVVPTFKAPNPMAPGTDMDIKNGRITVSEMRHRVDVASGRLLSSEGSLKMDANVDMGGMLVPASLSIKFAMAPQAKATEPAQ